MKIDPYLAEASFHENPEFFSPHLERIHFNRPGAREIPPDQRISPTL